MSSIKNIYSSDAYVNIETALDDSDNESGSELDEEERLVRQRKKEMNGLDIKYIKNRKRRSTKHPIL